MERRDPNGPADGASDVLLQRAEADLAGLDQLPTHEQVARFEKVHDWLVQALASTSPGGPGPGRPGA